MYTIVFYNVSNSKEHKHFYKKKIWCARLIKTHHKTQLTVDCEYCQFLLKDFLFANSISLFHVLLACDVNRPIKTLIGLNSRKYGNNKGQILNELWILSGRTVTLM